jgi:hypothetical protein
MSSHRIAFSTGHLESQVSWVIPSRLVAENPERKVLDREIAAGLVGCSNEAFAAGIMGVVDCIDIAHILSRNSK